MVSEDRTGTRLGRYRLLSLLGRGGMGTVYLAEHEGLGSLWVVKLLRPEFAADPQHVERFLHEARAVAALRHPNIVQVVDVDCSDSVPYLVMEHLEGEDLQKLLERAGPLPWRDARDIALQVCAAMQAAHRRGIIHRDLKPANLFCVARGAEPPHIKVLDFGIAKQLADDSLATATGVALGTPVYMAPERLQGAEAAASSDVYALGVVLYQLLTGRLPYDGTGPALLASMLSAAPPELCGVASTTLPPRLVEIVADALAPDPACRVSSMTELSGRLAGVVDLPEDATRPHAAKRPPTRPHAARQLVATRPHAAEPPSARLRAAARPSTRRLGLALVVAAAAALCVGVAAFAAPPAPPSPSPLAEPALPRPAPADEPAVRVAPAPPPVLAAPAPDCAQSVRESLRSFARQELTSCGRRHAASPGDDITVQLSVDAAGRARRVQMSPSYHHDEPFGRCVRRALLARSFAACAGATRTLTHHLVYGRRGAS